MTAVLTASLLAAAAVTSRTAYAQDNVPPGATCSAVRVPVGLGPGLPDSYQISGDLCLPAGGVPATVQVLVAGATYNRAYWDFPYEPATYSYVRAMLAAGYATLNIDPLGTGQSSRPLSALVTIASGAYAVHQVIQAARDGSAGTSFSRVILVSHSMGTALAWNEAASYHDVNGLIATGNVHVPSLLTAVPAVATLAPAFLDPKFASAGLDPGYLTTRPGTRGSDFYNAADADPAVIAVDESLKDTVTATFLATYFVEDINLDTSRIQVPVLIAVGQDDSIMCGTGGTNCSTSAALLNAEAPFYSPAACLQSYVLPGAGHDLNLSLNAQSFFGVAARWADRWIASAGPEPPRDCAGPAGPAS
jgi:pimeloyl-ACP methyl ester carboxylesterase